MQRDADTAMDMRRRCMLSVRSVYQAKDISLPVFVAKRQASHSITENGQFTKFVQVLFAERRLFIYLWLR
jgi:hypothetical protein